MTTRAFPLSLLPLAVLAGCAGNVADYMVPGSEIIAPQLTRYGFDLRETGCVGERLGAALTPLQLRRFYRAADSVNRGYFVPERLTARDLLHVAGTMEDPQVRTVLAGALDACGVTAEVEARRAETEQAVPAPVLDLPEPTWLNLGAAPTGQSIAVDAGSLEQEGTIRTAWFRLTDPGETEPGGNSYLLEVDCEARTINPLARRKRNAEGTVIEGESYPENKVPVEGGTIMEIAWLALCT